MKARGLIFAVTLLVAFIVTAVYGQSPMINYQGKVTDSDGVPLDGTYSIQFSIYSQETGGTALWTETQSSIVVENGIFNVLLGSVNPIPTSLFDGNSRWLGIKVGSDPEMSPRQQIVSVGYALRADKANEAGFASDSDKLDGQHASEFAPSGHIHDDRYYTESELNTTGTINQGGNPVDWTKLKNVPDGFADGIDAEGAADGHSLDAADGSPTDVIYVDNDGDVGIGTSTPTTALDVSGIINATGFTGDGSQLSGIGTQTKVGFIDKHLNLPAGTQSITVGFQPKAVILLGWFNSGEMFALGFSDGTTFECVSDLDGSSGTNWDNVFLLGNDTSNFQKIDDVNMTSNGFDIVWIKANNPTGSAAVFYLALK